MTLEEAAQKNPRAILVRSGVLFDVFNPNDEDVKIEDIIHALSNLCRYGGHCPEFYSVGQHSILCSYHGKTAQECMEMLMHDASEAYLVDLPRPIKRMLPDYIKAENALLTCIFKKFNLTFPLSHSVHKADDDMLKFEWGYFKNPASDLEFDYWTPKKTKREFIKRYNQLVRQIRKENKQNERTSEKTI
jgi:hypothetical protein